MTTVLPLQLTWKLKKDKVSQTVGKSLWLNTLLVATLLGQGNNYDYINRLFNAQVKLLQVNGTRLKD